MASSSLERAFLGAWSVRHPELPPVREFVIPGWRAWAEEQKRRGLRKRVVPMRADFAWPDARVALELQGGTWRRGGHSTGGGIERDATKAALAQLDGWVLLAFTSGMLGQPGTWFPRLAACIHARRSDGLA